MNDQRFEYVDRASGTRRTDPLLRGGLLNWAYNTAPGWTLTQLFLKRRWFSVLYGWLYGSRWSRRRIAPFVNSLGVEQADLVRPLESYASFGEFFSREIDLRRRPVDTAPESATAPADGRILVYPRVRAGDEFPVKGGLFRLGSLLAAEDVQFERAAVAVSRLYLADYHHFHFPAAGVPAATRSIPGSLHAVSPYAERRLVPFFAENYRHVTPFASDLFGAMAIVEVGAMTVGSIHQAFTPGRPVAKGARKGWFELGASVVVLVFREDAIRFDEDLVAHSARGLETYVRVGEAIGRARG